LKSGDESLRIYYAHPVEIYNTPRELYEASLIKELFPGAEIINPADFQELPGVSHETMDIFFNLIDSCD